MQLTQTNPNGVKLPGVGNFKSLENTCGGPQNGEKGGLPAKINSEYMAGDEISVLWDVTIPHDNAPGVRVAMAYGKGDLFTSNVLVDNYDVNRKSVQVKLPSNKGCLGCYLQWSWRSIEDDGIYMACSYVKINCPSTDPSCKGGDIVKIAEPSSAPAPSSGAPSASNTEGGVMGLPPFVKVLGYDVPLTVPVLIALLMVSLLLLFLVYQAIMLVIEKRRSKSKQIASSNKDFVMNPIAINNNDFKV
jgi:hypothetical protein